MKKEILRSSHTVMSYELDAFGHVNNAVYLNYLEKARNDFMIGKGMGFGDFFRWKKFPVVIRALLEFKSPARAGDRLDIRGWISDHTATGFTLAYEIWNDSGSQLILRGETVHVFIDEGNRPTRIPTEFGERFIRCASAPESADGDGRR